MKFSQTVQIGQHEFTFETGEIAKQANGAAICKYGGTAVFAASVMSKKDTDLDFFPLMVKYTEKMYSSGKIPGGFLKREGRPSEKEVLTSRLIDRPIRPLFPDGFNREVQITADVYSSDGINPADIAAINACCFSIAISDIPNTKSAAGVRVGCINDEIIINPTLEQMGKSNLDIIVCGTRDAITMVEGGAKEVPESLLIEACKKAQEAIIKLVDTFDEISKKIGKEKLVVEEIKENEAFLNYVEEKVSEDLTKALFVKEKLDRDIAINEVKEKYLNTFIENIDSVIIDDVDNEDKEEFIKSELSKYIGKLTKKIMRQSIINDDLRADGRDTKTVRPISINVGMFDHPHGSALFTRGETQSLSFVTLGTAADEQRIDNIEEESKRRFMLHYNFPPFSVGECGRVGIPGRREIGHGHLAQRSLEYVLPEYEKFPYTLRVVSEITESNGSSSMATVCCGSLAMYHAGVPIDSLVSGIAMGLIKEGDDYKVLTDIMGMEDHLGDMDFKVAGTKDGITAFQMDVKIDGISFEIFEKALAQANEGRNHILNKMEVAVKDKDSELSEYAPKIIKKHIDPEKVGLLIGPGGKTIKNIIAETESAIDIDDDGTLMISNSDQAMIAKTIDIIDELLGLNIIEGEVYEGTVKKIAEFGMFIDFTSSASGLLHISKISKGRMEKSDLYKFFKVGDKIKVRLEKIEGHGRYSLSHSEFFEGQLDSDNNKKSEKPNDRKYESRRFSKKSKPIKKDDDDSIGSFEPLKK